MTADIYLTGGEIPEDLLEFFEPINFNALTDVFHIATRPYSGAHFATMPPELAERCILAGTSERGQCPHCGTPWKRDVAVERVKHPQSPGKGGRQTVPGSESSERSIFNTGLVPVVTTLGFSPACDCPEHTPVPQLVLDPFAGAGTTLLTAVKHRREAVGVELNPEYIRLIHERLATVQVNLFD